MVLGVVDAFLTVFVAFVSGLVCVIVLVYLSASLILVLVGFLSMDSFQINSVLGSIFLALLEVLFLLHLVLVSCFKFFFLS